MIYIYVSGYYIFLYIDMSMRIEVFSTSRGVRLWFYLIISGYYISQYIDTSMGHTGHTSGSPIMISSAKTEDWATMSMFHLTKYVHSIIIFYLCDFTQSLFKLQFFNHLHNMVSRNIMKVSLLLIKVSGATARWPFTDSAVPSLLLLLLRSAGLQPADLLLILLFLPHYYYYYSSSNINFQKRL